MKRSLIPSLDDLRAFETVARLGSVRAAAAEMVLTHGAVSRRISKISEDLKLQLFEPQGRGLRLTPEGEKLAAATTNAFDVIANALAQLQSANKQPITLSCERSLAMRWLIPRLSSFQDQHPDIEIHLSTGGGSVNFSRERVDIGLRRLDFPLDPEWNVVKLMPEQVGPVMVQALRAAFDAGNYVALGSRTRPDAWQLWLQRHPDTPRPTKSRMFDHHFLMMEAAASGLGVAMAPEAIATTDVAVNRLQAPMGFTADGSEYGLILSKAVATNKDVQTLMDWLLSLPKKA